MPILGVIASSISGNLWPANSYESIATTTVGAGGSSSITFSAITSAYTHLQIRYSARTSRVSTSEDINLQINSDTANNYSWHLLYGDGANFVVNSAATTFRMLVPSVSSANATANIFGSGIVDILDYTNTNKFKTVRSLGGSDRNGAGEMMLESGNWRSTSVVSSLTFTPSAGGNFVQYTTFALYGIKGS